MLEEENQMGLFETADTAPELQTREPAAAPAAGAHPAPAAAAGPAPARPGKPAPSPGKPAHSAPPGASAHPAPPASAKPRKKGAVPVAVGTAPATKVSGLVPLGDVRLTANVRQDLHLKLKIASAHRRTTIGEIIEELIEMHL